MHVYVYTNGKYHPVVYYSIPCTCWHGTSSVMGELNKLGIVPSFWNNVFFVPHTKDKQALACGTLQHVKCHVTLRFNRSLVHINDIIFIERTYSHLLWVTLIPLLAMCTGFFNLARGTHFHGSAANKISRLSLGPSL